MLVCVEGLFGERLGVEYQRRFREAAYRQGRKNRSYSVYSLEGRFSDAVCSFEELMFGAKVVVVEAEGLELSLVSR
jgi:hypothetical protein